MFLIGRYHVSIVDLWIIRILIENDIIIFKFQINKRNLILFKLPIFRFFSSFKPYNIWSHVKNTLGGLFLLSMLNELRKTSSNVDIKLNVVMKAGSGFFLLRYETSELVLALRFSRLYSCGCDSTHTRTVCRSGCRSRC